MGWNGEEIDTEGDAHGCGDGDDGAVGVRGGSVYCNDAPAPDGEGGTGLEGYDKGGDDGTDSRRREGDAGVDDAVRADAPEVVEEAAAGFSTYGDIDAIISPS